MVNGGGVNILILYLCTVKNYCVANYKLYKGKLVK